MLGAQAAREQETQLAKSSGTPMNAFEERNLRERLLVLAQQAPSDGIVSASEVVNRATTYLTFIKGGTDG